MGDLGRGKKMKCSTFDSVENIGLQPLLLSNYDVFRAAILLSFFTYSDLINACQRAIGKVRLNRVFGSALAYL